MNDWDDNDGLRKWLDAEGADAPDEADRLFSVVASAHLRRLEAPAGLTDRVLAALPARSFTAARPLVDVAGSWWGRLASLAAVVLLGLGLALVTPRHLIELGTEAVSLAARAADGFGVSLSAAVGVWRASLQILGTLGQAAGHFATTGVMPLVIAANLGVACAAFAGLKRLLTPREECV